MSIQRICSVALLSLLMSTTAIAVSASALDERDPDHDGFPTWLERATGNDPLVFEALKKSGSTCGVLKTDPAKLGEPTNVLIILDSSGSMSAKLGTVTRMEAAKNILARYIEALPPSIRVGLAVYGKADCGENSLELIAPIGGMKRATIIEHVRALTPRGTTPIALSLMKCLEYFGGREKENNTMILVSDGAESCGGNPLQAIRDLKESVFNPEVIVIGLGVSGSAKKQLDSIAKTADGTYADVQKEEDLHKAFAGYFNQMNKLYKDIVCIVRQYNAFLMYETQQYNKSKNYLTTRMDTAEGETRNVYKRTLSQIEENHKKREDAKDKLDEMIKNKMQEMQTATERFVK